MLRKEPHISSLIDKKEIILKSGNTEKQHLPQIGSLFGSIKSVILVGENEQGFPAICKIQSPSYLVQKVQ